MSGYFCIGFIDFMLKGKILLEHTNFFSSNDYEKNDKIILKYFQKYFEKTKKIKKSNILVFVVSIENLKNLNCHTS